MITEAACYKAPAISDSDVEIVGLSFVSKDGCLDGDYRSDGFEESLLHLLGSIIFLP
jgi:hypothetical protein